MHISCAEQWWIWKWTAPHFARTEPFAASRRTDNEDDNEKADDDDDDNDDDAENNEEYAAPAAIDDDDDDDNDGGGGDDAGDLLWRRSGGSRVRSSVDGRETSANHSHETKRQNTNGIVEVSYTGILNIMRNPIPCACCRGQRTSRVDGQTDLNNPALA